MASGNKILAVTLGIIGGFIAIKIAIGFLNQPSDKELIRDAITEAQKASREGRSGGVLEFLSKDLVVNQTEAGTSRSSIADYIKKMKPDVSFAESEPDIQGDSARLETDAKVTFAILGFSRSIDIPKTIIRFQKVESADWLIIPKKSWKITNIEVPTESLVNLPNLGDSIPGGLPGL